MRGRRRLERARLMVATAALALLIAVLPALAAAQDDRASVRVIHGVSDVGPIDLYIDGAIAVVGATFPSVTDPLDIAGGEHRIVVAPSGLGVDAALVDSTLTIDAGTTAEIAVVGSVAGLNAVLFGVDRSPLAADQARLRIIHASPDAGPIEPAFVGAEALFPSVDYLLATEYVEVAAGNYPLELRLTDDGADLLTVPDLELEAGTVTDVYVVGQVADDTLQPLLVGAQTEAGEPAAPAPTDAPEEPTAAPAPETAAVADPETLPRSSSLRAGTCEALGAEVAPIAEVTVAVGVEVGPQDGAAVGNGFATIPVAFDAIVAADHAIVVVGDDAATACGEVGGRLTDDGALAVPLVAADGAARGVAVLFPNVLDPTTTDISVFFVPRQASNAGESGDDGAVVPTATEADAEPPVTVAVEAVGTPATAPVDAVEPGVEEVGA